MWKQNLVLSASEKLFNSKYLLSRKVAKVDQFDVSFFLFLGKLEKRLEKCLSQVRQIR